MLMVWYEALFKQLNSYCVERDTDMKNISRAIIVTFIVMPFLVPQISHANDLTSANNQTADNISSKIINTKSAAKENRQSNVTTVLQTRSAAQDGTTPQGGVLFS